MVKMYLPIPWFIYFFILHVCGKIWICLSSAGNGSTEQRG